MGSEESQPQPQPQPKQQQSRPQQQNHPQSRPQQQQSRPQQQNTEQARPDQIEEMLPELAYLHKKYEELSFNSFDVLNTPNRSDSSTDLFYISVCYPYYCKSVRDMIRQAIRIQSMAVAREQPDYQNNFLFSENMANCREKVLDRCSYRRQLHSVYQNANPLAIKYNSEREEINFDKILQLLRNTWAHDNQQRISELQNSLIHLTGLSFESFMNQDLLRQIFIPTMGEDMATAIVPCRTIVWREIDGDISLLNNILRYSKARLCMTFPKTSPLNAITLEGHVIKHGICSNGKFLFILTDRRELYVYSIYKGLIYTQKRKVILGENLTLNNETFLFCSQRWLFLRDNNATTQIPIVDLLNSEEVHFEQSRRPALCNMRSACSNGATYSLINSENRSFQVYDAGSERRIVNSENSHIYEHFSSLHQSTIMITNGSFIGTFLPDGKLQITQAFNTREEAYQFTIDFPTDDDLSIEAMTIDVLTSTYFSVSFEGQNSKIYSHPYTGAPDLSLFGLKMKDSLYTEILGSRLLTYVLPIAFSPTIPENLISNSENVEKDILNIACWIKKSKEDVNLTTALIILLDFNLAKYKSKKIANEILPTMIEYMFLGQYKRIVSAFLINNFDLFFDSITLTALDQIKEIFRHPNNVNGNVFNEWALNKLSHTAALSKFIVNEELLSSIFGELWFRESRSNERNSWLVDLLLASQQNLFEEMQVIIDKDPLNLENSELVNFITDYASLLINHFYEMIKQIIEVFQDRQMRKLDYDCILYTLISNFFAAAAPVTNCTQLANVMTNDKCISIMKMLSEDFEADDTLKSFIGFFDMIYTVSISGLIRGGNTYQCEKDYEWLIHANFNNGSRNLTPDVISDVTIFLSSLQNDFIRNESEDMNYLYSKINNFRSPRREYEIIDRYIMAAVTHQTNTFHLLSERNPGDRISPELRAICNWLRKIRLGYSSIVQNENSQGNEQNDINEKQSDKFLANLGILINLDPVFENYLERNNADKKECLNNLEQFIKNNDPTLFHKVLKAIPKRLEYLLSGFSKLNSLFNNVQNRTFQTIIIDGISRVDSFERTGFLLEHAQLDDNALSVLTIFYMTCISLVCDFDRFSVLEILYTVLVSCSYFKQNAIEVMNQLSLKASNDRCLEDPFFMTIAGLARSTLTLPQNFQFLPDIAKASIFHLIYTKKNAPTLTMMEIFNFILNNYNDSIIFDVMWIKMIFTVFIKCQDDETGTLNNILQNIFNTVSERLNNKCTVFNTLPEIIYGFRTVLNSGNERSILLQTILASITVDSSLGEIFLLLAIIGGDISDYSMYYAIRNRHGTWFKCTKYEQENYLQIPIAPLSKGMTFDINEISEPVQDVDLKLEMGLSFETILAFSEVCMRDQGSLLCRLYLQTLSKYISTTNENIPQELLSSLARSAKPYIDFHILSTNQTNLYKHLTSSFNLSERLLPESEFGLGRIEQSNSTHLFAFNIMALGDYAINVTFQGDGYLIIHRMDPIVIQIPSGIINQGDDSISIVNGSLEITVIGEQSLIIVNEHLCPSEPYTYLEFIADSMENIVFNMNRQDDFTNSQICFNNIDNLNVDYSNDIFENVNPIEEFADDLQTIAPLGFQTVNAQSIEREGMNKPFNNEISDVGFNERLPFTGSSSMYNLLGRKNEFSICNQIKSVILAQAAINDPGSLDWPIAFSLIKSAVVAVGSFSKSKLMSGEFPYQLNEGFFRSCALNYLHNRNIQILYIALKTLIKSETIMNNLGKQLVIMAQDRTYHSLIHKKDLVYIKPEQIARFERAKMIS